MPAVGAKKSRLATASDAPGAMGGGFLQRRAKDFTVADAEFFCGSPQKRARGPRMGGRNRECVHASAMSGMAQLMRIRDDTEALPWRQPL
jgi:hypothetical protein